MEPLRCHCVWKIETLEVSHAINNALGYRGSDFGDLAAECFADHLNSSKAVRGDI